MKINVITVKTGPNFNAGQKAPRDIVQIIVNNFDACNLVVENFNSEEFLNNHCLLYRVLCRFSFFKYFIRSRKNDNCVIIQYPLEERTNFLHKLFMFNMRFLNKDRTIFLIHDLDGIRYQNDMIMKQDLERLNSVKYIIVHNDIMKNELIKLGVKAKIYSLELFDYLCDYDNTVSDRHIVNKKIDVIYAGNLKKSPFIFSLEDSKMKFNLFLYGVGIDNDISKKIKYKGKFNANELPNKLEGNLGLIWDGELGDNDSDLGLKNYTRYNNPHKLSCYIAAGIPVIVWRQAAVSKFVLENNIGYVIDNLYDINTLDLSDYEDKLCNVKMIQNKVRNGTYTTTAITNILKDMVS